MVKLYRLVIPLLTFLALFSCTPSPDEFAVVLWPDTDSSLRPGTILPIFGSSDIDNSLMYEVETQEGTIEPWRTMRFSDEEDAEEYAASFDRWKDTYALSLRTALPVRERPDRASTRMYRLRDGEIVKVLDRQDEISDEAGFEDYWYEVLTREGISGWVFGYYLELTGASGRALDPRDEHDGTDRIVADISEEVWRPVYFADMVASGRIDLERFSSRFGFFGDREAQEFQIVLPTIQRTFRYDSYYSSDGRVIEFNGTDLIIEFSSEDRITVRYSINGRQRSDDFFLFAEDIAVIIEAERERRAQQLDRFLQRGTGLISTAYGTMRLTDRGAITWSGFQRLVPGVLPTDFGGSGRLSFDLYLDDDLRGRYDGAAALVAPGERIHFLYSFTDDGVRFIYVPSSNVTNDGVVMAEPISPVVIFFRFVAE
jgi:hypothetical protein